MKKEIIEGNKLIADFMELESRDAIGIEKSNRCTKMFKFENKHIGGWSFTWVADGALKYHSSWDWLMPVVSKCYEFGNLGSGFRTAIEESLIGIVDIDQTWFDVVEFIKWYNKK